MVEIVPNMRMDPLHLICVCVCSVSPISIRMPKCGIVFKSDEFDVFFSLVR